MTKADTACFFLQYSVFSIQYSTFCVESAALLSRATQPSAGTAQSDTFLSYPAEATTWPSGEKATALTGPSCCPSVAISCPLTASHNFTVPSWLPDTSSLPSGETASECTLSVCPCK